MKKDLKSIDEPAFPIPLHYDQCVCPCGNTGMSLRDWLAGQAIMGWALYLDPTERGNRQELVKDVAENAYCIADAMLAERDKRGEGK